MKLYLKFKGASDAGHFEYYDKEKATNVKFNLTKLAVTEVNYKIMGWDENSNSAIYSNCITKFADEEMTVKSAGGTLCSGIYKDIKEDVINKGAKLHINITGVVDGQEVNIALKGLNFFQVSEVLKGMDITKDFLSFKGTEDDKKGAVKFKKTIFEKGSKTTESDYVIKGEEEFDDIFK